MFDGNTARKIDDNEDLSSYSDSELLTLVAEKSSANNQAFNEITMRHYNWIYRICTMRLGNTADAQDVSQDVFMRMRKYAHKFEKRSAVRTWLYRIAQNQCNTFDAKFNKLKCEDIEDFSNVLLDKYTENNISKVESEDLIHHVMSKLPNQCKNIIELRFFRELSLVEISRQLDIGLSATKMRLYRALNQFKLIYKKECMA